MKQAVLIVFSCFLTVCNCAVSNAQLIVAHRGASFEAPENTRAAFLLAWEKSADAIEGDFYLTRDCKIVCTHDSTTERLCDVNLSVTQSTLAQLQQLDVGSWKDRSFSHQRMPSLREVLKLVPSDKSMFIEIKSGPEIVPFLKRRFAEQCISPCNTFVISFNENVIRSVKEQMPRYCAYWLVGFHKDEHSGKWAPSIEDVIATAKGIGADGVDLNANTEVVNAEAVDRCHRSGLSVHVWTVDNLDKAIELQEMGVDSITTNRSDILRKRLFQTASSSRLDTRLPSSTTASISAPDEILAEPIAIPK